MPWTMADDDYFTETQQERLYDYIDADFIYNTEDLDPVDLAKELITDGLFADLIDWSTLSDPERAQLEKMIVRYIEIARENDD